MAWQEALKLLSAVEVQSMLYATYDIGYIDEKTHKERYAQASTTKALINTLKKSLKIPPKP